MKKVLATLMVFAVSCFGSIVFAAEGETPAAQVAVAPVVTGNIEVYGVAKLSVDMITTDAKAAGADKSLTKVSSNSSRLGFKGSEALSDDLSAVMQLELGINYDGTQTATVASVSSATTNTATGVTTVKTKAASIDKITYRNTYVGLNSKTFGTIILGIYDTPYKTSTASLDAFADSMADYNAIIGDVNATSDFDLRVMNTVMYTSPKVAGVQIMAQTSTTGQESDTSVAGSNKQEYSFSATYANGPLYVALANEVHKNGYGTLDIAGNKIEGTKLGAGLTVKDTKVGLVYEALKNSVADSPNTRNALYLAVSQKLGNETVKIAYGQAEDGKSAAKTGAALTAIGVDHSFSKRTSAYVLYAKMKNDSGATYGLGQSGGGGSYAPAAAGESPSVIAFGVNHSF